MAIVKSGHTNKIELNWVLTYSHVLTAISQAEDLPYIPGYLAEDVSKPFTFSSRMKRGILFNLQSTEVLSFTKQHYFTF